MPVIAQYITVELQEQTILTICEFRLFTKGMILSFLMSTHVFIFRMSRNRPLYETSL